MCWLGVIGQKTHKVNICYNLKSVLAIFLDIIYASESIFVRETKLKIAL
jgi:hypothetical protein